ncbi:hypothetical protein B566_EDAN013928 [Ephemera danica]|nr:hypothetical protein B566_EDAN013928 [Ephemera danica]
MLVKRPILDGGHSKEDKLPRPGNEGPLQNLPDLMSFDEENLELIAKVAETVAGNIHFAADNISSAVASAYSAFRQKTYEMQDSLEELGATARSRLKRHSLTSLQDALAESGNSPTPKTPNLNFLLPTHDLDSLSLSNRSSCSSSTEDLTSRPESAASVAPDRIVESSQDDATDHISSEEQLINQALEQWKALDAGRLGDREEELCYLVVNILFTVMWRGIEGASKEAWKVSCLF